MDFRTIWKDSIDPLCMQEESKINPNWKPGQKFDTSILDNVTRESAEATLVKMVIG